MVMAGGVYSSVFYLTIKHKQFLVSLDILLYMMYSLPCFCWINQLPIFVSFKNNINHVFRNIFFMNIFCAVWTRLTSYFWLVTQSEIAWSSRMMTWKLYGPLPTCPPGVSYWFALLIALILILIALSGEGTHLHLLAGGSFNSKGKLAVSVCCHFWTP